MTSPLARSLQRIGWLVSSKDIRSASQRYRCYHMARVLAQSGIESLYYKDPDALLAELRTLDAVIVVKRMDPGVVRVAAEARQNGVPLFLDFCDDLLSERYSREPETGLLFTAVASFLAGVTVPSATMAQRVQEAAAQLGIAPPPVHVIPDIAETRTIYHLTEQFVGQHWDEATPPPFPEPKASEDRRQVLWYGNYGSGHSNFGIFSLAPVLPALAAVHKDLPLELVVLSNSESLFDSLTEGCGFPVRYIPWSPGGVYDALERADVVLNTSGTDAFCAGKSANRPLQALASGVPVVSDPSPALAEFEGIVLTGQYEANLRLCLRLGPAERHARFVAPAQPLLERYSPQAIAGLWRSLLERAVQKIAALPGKAPARRLLMVLGTRSNPKHLEAWLKSAHEAGLDREVLTTENALSEKALRVALAQRKLLPRVLKGGNKSLPRLLTGAGVLCQGGEATPEITELCQIAKARGLPVLPLAAELPDWQALLPADPSRDRLPATAAMPGPNPETPGEDGSADWLFVVHPNNRGWILDAISREIGSRQLTDWAVAYNPRPLPPARTYFFTHYSLFQGALRRDPAQLARAKSLIWYTHPRDDSPAAATALLEAFNRAHRVIFACSEHRDLWIRRGLPPEKGVLVLGGADPALFTGHQRGSGVIGLSSSFYERKNPELLRDLVRRLPHRRFHLLGRNWERYALFEALLAAPNFHYDPDLPYSAYPEVYKGFDVFLSTSKLEGGPIPLLEAMMENAVPVASRTGFAPDLIDHGQNGYLFDTDAPAAEVAGLIEAAFETTADIRASVLGYDWDSFARRIVELAQ